MLDLNIKKFEQQLQEKQSKHNDTFEHILHKCRCKMELGLSKGHGGIYFEVPEFLIGKPVYKLNDCIKFIIISLSNRGFSIKYFFPRVLYVSWENIRAQSKPLLPLISPPDTLGSNGNSNFTKLVNKNKNNKLTLDV